MKKMDTHSMILSFFFATLQTLHSPKGKKKTRKKSQKIWKTLRPIYSLPTLFRKTTQGNREQGHVVPLHPSFLHIYLKNATW